MADLKYKTRGNESPQGKPRIYFCCHKEDFEKYFKAISDDILKRQNCAIWYTDEPTIRNEDFLSDLKLMQLFIMPVTKKLLTQYNYALDVEFKFAIENHIPVLPLMQENGLEALFNEKCGELQALSKNDADKTAVSYEEKLTRYLESVLIGDELADKVRNAFDAYIFLSYRKKDRKYAQELMSLIHKYDSFRDIAIWYDEFLTPGENFNNSIKSALEKSDLFVMAVTPNLVNETNYIMTTEYPLALKKGKPILTAELIPTSKTDLLKKYNDIPIPTNVYNEYDFAEALSKAIKRIATRRTPHSPQHNFFIGLAYLGGIDVEVDYKKAVELITSAAEAGLPDAMKKLYDMYTNGIGVRLNYSTALYWAEKAYNAYKSTKGETHDDTTATLWDLINAYFQNGEYEKALSLAERKYQITAELYGEENINSLRTLHWVANGYIRVGQYKKALEIAQKLYDIHSKQEDKYLEETMSAASMVANSQFKLGNFKAALPIYQKIYDYCLSKFGEEHSQSVIILNWIANTLLKLKSYEQALQLSQKAYEQSVAVSGENHPTTAWALHIISSCYINLGEAKNGLLFSRKAYETYCYIFHGPDNSDAQSALSNIGRAYLHLKKYKIAARAFETIYKTACEMYGEMHLNCVLPLNNLAAAYNGLKKHKKALHYSNLALNIQTEKRKKEHPDSLIVLGNNALCLLKTGNKVSALTQADEVYQTALKLLGESHTVTINSMGVLSAAKLANGEIKDALQLGEKAYEMSKMKFGERHYNTKRNKKYYQKARLKNLFHRF